MPSEKIIGYILLSIGIILMLISSIQIVMVFTGKAKPIEVFRDESPPSPTKDPSFLDTGDPKDFLAQIQKDPLSLLEKQGASSGFPSFFDPAMLYQTLNLITYYVIMQFVLGLGYKLATLGVQMLRPIEVKVDESRLTKTVQSSPMPPSSAS